MTNYTELFCGKEWQELAEKNVEFTKGLYNETVSTQQEIVKRKLDEYFQFVNTNIEFLNECYDKASKTNTDIADLYRENFQKIYDISRTVVEKATTPPQPKK